jgi:hypothetical protein
MASFFMMKRYRQKLLSYILLGFVFVTGSYPQCVSAESNGANDTSGTPNLRGYIPQNFIGLVQISAKELRPYLENFNITEMAFRSGSSGGEILNKLDIDLNQNLNNWLIIVLKDDQKPERVDTIQLVDHDIPMEKLRELIETEYADTISIDIAKEGETNIYKMQEYLSPLPQFIANHSGVTILAQNAEAIEKVITASNERDEGTSLNWKNSYFWFYVDLTQLKESMSDAPFDVSIMEVLEGSLTAENSINHLQFSLKTNDPPTASEWATLANNYVPRMKAGAAREKPEALPFLETLTFRAEEGFLRMSSHFGEETMLFVMESIMESAMNRKQEIDRMQAAEEQETPKSQPAQE